MNEGCRIKLVRNSLNLTMEEFGSRLGVTRAAISNIEKGNRGVTEQMLKSITREFRVNEEWLRTGLGEMFLSESTDELYKKAAKSIASGAEEMDHIVRQLLIYYFQMDNDSKKVLMGHLRTLASMVQVQPEFRQYLDAPSQETLEKFCPPVQGKDVG